METKIDIRPHRRYQFRTDFWIDWLKLDAGDKDEIKRYEKLDDDWYCFTLDCVDHSAVTFNLVLDRVNLGYYEMDRARNVWIIWVKKEHDISQKMALDIARYEIEQYNNYINGWDEEDEYME